MMAPALLSRFQVRHVYPLFPIGLFAILAAGPLGDNSFLWHVRAGAMQIQSGRVLTRDPFSYVAGGEAWRTQSWIAELLYGVLEKASGGVGWASVMVALAIAGTLALVGLAMYASNRSPLAVAIWLFALGWILIPFSQPRPVVLSYVLLSIVVLTLALGKRASWAVVPIIWLWAGVHGSWVIGLALVMLTAIRRRSLRTGLAGAAAGLATAATAHGLGAWAILLTFARNSGALEYMDEWHVPDFTSPFQAPFLLILVGVLIAAIHGKVAMADLWVVLPFMALGFTSQRAVPVAAIVLVPVAARSMRLQMRSSVRGAEVLPWIVAGLMIGGVAVAHAWPRAEFNHDRFPPEVAFDVLGSGRFFHDDVVGGFLIYRYGPGRHVYFDDRAELYGATRIEEFISARDGDYEALFERLNMTAALVRRDWRLGSVLEEDGWDLKYQDDEFQVWLPNTR